MLKLWGYVSSSTCVLCNGNNCTLHHLLVNCKFALDQGRYTWRHDSVLLDIEQALLKLIRNFNSKKPACFADVARKEYQMSFVKAGEQKRKPSHRAKPKHALLEYANDWKMQVDFKDRKLVFPPVICSTELRPDGVIWSVLTRTVILLELTCCAEEGIEAAQIRKEARYADLMSLVSERKWAPTLLTLEVGARGLVCSKTFHAFVKLGFSNPGAKSLCRSLSEIVARCSYAIYLGHSSPAWPHNNDLVRGKNSETETKSEPLMVLKPDPADPVVANIVQLKQNGISKLYHFTDFSRRFKKNGLMSAHLIKQEISSTMNSSKGSRQSLCGLRELCASILL